MQSKQEHILEGAFWQTSQKFVFFLKINNHLIHILFNVVKEQWTIADTS